MNNKEYEYSKRLIGSRGFLLTLIVIFVASLVFVVLGETVNQIFKTRIGYDAR